MQPLISKDQNTLMTPEAHLSFPPNTPFFPSICHPGSPPTYILFFLFSLTVFPITLYYFYLAYTNNSEKITWLSVAF